MYKYFIMSNATNNKKKTLVNGNSNSYDDSKCISKTCTTLTSIALNGHGAKKISREKEIKKNEVSKRQTDKHHTNDMIAVYVILS